ncbi:MAG TPA: SDR family oxidoreductase [Acidimicrobiia bacterium]|nr:SDR family oxidoreductase [Acidimicrobiia bacterium]
MEGRRYIVTGAAGGIGSAITQVLVDRGGLVAMVDLDGDRVEEAATTFDSSRVLALPCDVTNESDVATAVETVVDTWDGIDGLVNNAGAVVLDTAWEAGASDWRRQLDVNVTGTFLCSRQVGSHLKARGGAIVNVASNCGKVGYKNMAAYNAAKAAVISLTRSLAMEWAEHNINVNAVCPGGVDTPMLAGVAEWLEPRVGISAADLLAGMGPTQLGRKVQPIEVARVIAFLLSDEALIIRGQAINVDGGDTPY